MNLDENEQRHSRICSTYQVCFSFNPCFHLNRYTIGGARDKPSADVSIFLIPLGLGRRYQFGGT